MKAWAWAGLALLSLAACKQESNEAVDDGSGPQVATSIDDFSLPADRSAQITAIDAATGDARGMPRDGGAVVAQPKPEPRPAVIANEAAPVPAPPLIVPPPPPMTVAPAQAE